MLICIYQQLWFHHQLIGKQNFMPYDESSLIVKLIIKVSLLNDHFNLGWKRGFIYIMSFSPIQVCKVDNLDVCKQTSVFEYLEQWCLYTNIFLTMILFIRNFKYLWTRCSILKYLHLIWLKSNSNVIICYFDETFYIQILKMSIKRN